MNDSIEIIEIVSEPKSFNNSENELEILYDGASFSPFSLTLPQARAITPKRPLRSRKPIRTLREELQKEQCNKRKRSLQSPRLKKRISRGNLSIKHTKTPKKKTFTRPLINIGLKIIEDEIQITNEIKKSSCKITNNKRISVSDDSEFNFEWDPAKVIAERQGIAEWQAKSTIKMFDQENTLPFIARYRKENTGNLPVEKLREIQNSYSQLKIVQEKVTKILKNNLSTQKVPEDRKAALLRATTVVEVEHLSASLKSCSKRSYAERARELGLNDCAVQIMGGQILKFNSPHFFNSLINPLQEGLKTIDEVEQGIRHIIADIISKDVEALEFIRDLIRNCRPLLECCRKKPKSDKACKSNITGPNEELCNKFTNYFNFSTPAWGTRPHQILAINRGEAKGVLAVKVIIPDGAYSHFYNFCHKKWLYSISPQHYVAQMIVTSIQDSWDRLVKPFMQRHIRSQLTDTSEIASVGVFTANLKKLLLTPPVRGKTVMAIDPGFQNGCKIGVTNCQGEVLLTTTIYPFKGKSQTNVIPWHKDHNARTLCEIVNKYSCELIAVGNGSACRQTEEYLTNLIQSGCFEPHNVQYAIVNESGASQYSVSTEAKTEFPEMDVNHISAVSLARRLQDPLLEYVKVHPMHLGVGMYQHDIPEKLLHSSLDSVMVECVSFVGVDINVASEFVLRKLSGLNKNRAAKIVEHRRMKGPFINRNQLKSVKGIGPRTFEQCAGFIRIMPSSLEAQIQKTPMTSKKSSSDVVCPLDRTMIHPESYEIANRYMNIVSVKPQNIGSESFIRDVRDFTQKSSLINLAELCVTTVPTMQLIVEGLTQPLDFDLRAQFEKPLFRKGITSMNDVVVGTRLTGTVRNVTDFGAFVDIGVGTDGLIHLSKMNGMRIELGSIVEVKVTNLEKERNRIGLFLERVL